MLLATWLVFVAALACLVSSEKPQRPHIVFIMADDLGWNDVGFHGNNEVRTPNIDALAYSGLILQRHYVSAICSPSRSALMTGRHPIHTGMQHTVLFGAEPRGLPLTERLLPEYLRHLGYATHIVGKWHLGNYRREYTPTFRGFDSHLGYWTGHQDYYDHTAVENPYWGVDMRRGMDPAWDLHGKYSTHVFSNEAVRLVKAHNASQPMFLYLAHAAVHSGNPYNPLPAPDETVDKFSTITNYKRRRFSAMLLELDQSVGAVVDALRSNGMLQHSVIVFTSDNGGPAAGFNLNAASNWPLRGVKNTLWEGGVRAAAALWSPLLARPGRVAQQILHITDWLPTLYSVAGGDPRDLGNIDGFDAWRALSEDLPTSRTEILHNIDDIYGNAALTIGEWKIVQGSTYNGTWDAWYDPSGREGHYDVSAVQRSPAGCALGLPDLKQILERRGAATLVCDRPPETRCSPLSAPCLFNVYEDPCELCDVAKQHPNVLKVLKDALARHNATAVPPGNVPLDSRADPKYWDHTWTNFGDSGLLSNNVS